MGEVSLIKLYIYLSDYILKYLRKYITLRYYNYKPSNVGHFNQPN